VIDRYLTVGLGIVAALVLVWAFWTSKQLEVVRAEHQAAVSELHRFKDRVAHEAAAAEARNALIVQEQETHLANTRTAYQISMDRLSQSQRSRVRNAAPSRVCPDSGPMSSDAGDTIGTDGSFADTGPRAEGDTASEIQDSVIERCQQTTVQCAWLQEAVRPLYRNGTE
jgi:hypothetical protein